MPSFDDMKKMYSNVGTVGQILKNNSDLVMQLTFDNDVATRQCYIYDYFHDDQPKLLGGEDYHPEKSVAKTPVKLKMIVKEYKSVSKDEPEYHIMFEPNVWNNQICVPDYFRNTYGKLDIRFPVGLYCDIPDDRGIYWKWLIAYSEVANQFPKFGILKCNYNFQWVTNNGSKSYKRQMCGVQRSQNSYNSGIYTYDKTTVLENQTKCWLPWNNISSEIYYNQRIIVSMPIEKPNTWKISKVENTNPKGINMFTLYQDIFNPQSDYVEHDDNGLDIIGMWADYYKTQIEPVVEEDIPMKNNIRLESNSTSIKLGKVIKKKYYSGSKTIDILFDQDMDNFNIEEVIWKFELEKKDNQGNETIVDITNEILTDYSINRIIQSYDGNSMKFIMNGTMNDYGSILKVSASYNELNASIRFDVVSL